MQKTNVNSKTLKEYVEFLIKQGLVKERSVREGRIVYEITPRGVLVLRHQRTGKNASPIGTD